MKTDQQMVFGSVFTFSLLSAIFKYAYTFALCMSFIKNNTGVKPREMIWVGRKDLKYCSFFTCFSVTKKDLPKLLQTADVGPTTAWSKPGCAWLFI